MQDVKEPLVSVVIPTFNYGQFVCEAVDSALAQTYPHVEVIVVDDGSTDDTRERLARYGERIRYHYQENAGLSAARNTGIMLAKGDLIALLDSDDVFHPRKLEIQVRSMMADPTIDLCATEAIEGPRPDWPPLADADLTAQDVSLDQLVIRTRFGSCSVVVRKSCFDAVGNFDTSMRSAEDRDMWIRIAARFRVVRISAPLWWYRPTPGSMSRNAAKMEHFERVVIEKAFKMPELRGRWLLKQKALGLAAYSAAHRYLVSGERKRAWGRMVWSFLNWPFPIHVPDVRMPFGRLRLFARSSLVAVFGQ